MAGALPGSMCATSVKDCKVLLNLAVGMAGVKVARFVANNAARYVLHSGMG